MINPESVNLVLYMARRGLAGHSPASDPADMAKAWAAVAEVAKHFEAVLAPEAKVPEATPGNPEGPQG